MPRTGSASAARRCCSRRGAVSTPWPWGLISGWSCDRFGRGRTSRMTRAGRLSTVRVVTEPLLDLGRPEDAHMHARLSSEPIAWLGTTTPAGRPHHVPVWFLWDDPLVHV